MSEDKNTWSVSCQNGGCDFTKSGATAEAANKAAESHTRDLGHPTITEHIPGGVPLREQVNAQEAKNAEPVPVSASAPAHAHPDDPAQPVEAAAPAKVVPAEEFEHLIEDEGWVEEPAEAAPAKVPAKKAAVKK